MNWAILNQENMVVSIIEQDDRPDHGVKAFPESKCAVGRFWNGATFDAPRWSAFQFLLRFTPEERAAIRATGMSNQVVDDFLFLATAAQEVVADDPMTVAGMDYLVSLGILTTVRRDEILQIVTP